LVEPVAGVRQDIMASLTAENAAVFFVMRSLELATVHPRLLVPIVNFVYKERAAMTQSLAVRTAAVRDLV